MFGRDRKRIDIFHANECGRSLIRHEIEGLIGHQDTERSLKCRPNHQKRFHRIIAIAASIYSFSSFVAATGIAILHNLKYLVVNYLKITLVRRFPKVYYEGKSKTLLGRVF